MQGSPESALSEVERFREANWVLCKKVRSIPTIQLRARTTLRAQIKPVKPQA